MTRPDTRSWKPRQRRAVISWVAEGLRLHEAQTRAMGFEPPFTISKSQYDGVVSRSRKKIAEERDRVEREAVEEGFARRMQRVMRLERLLDRKLALIEARGADLKDDVPGGETGLLVRDYRGSLMMPVYKYDAALAKEIREYMKQIAIELGQWTEKRELTGADGAPLLDPLAAALEKAYGNSEQSTTDSD